jgi:hypothetical protein
VTGSNFGRGMSELDTFVGKQKETKTLSNINKLIMLTYCKEEKKFKDLPKHEPGYEILERDTKSGL